VVADWHAFLAARDTGALMLWGLAVVLGALIGRMPARWRGIAVIVTTLYAGIRLCFGFNASL